MTNSLLLKMAWLKFVGFPMFPMVILHSYVRNYQRVNPWIFEGKWMEMVYKY